jgi:hypothetical protein
MSEENGPARRPGDVTGGDETPSRLSSLRGAGISLRRVRRRAARKLGRLAGGRRGGPTAGREGRIPPENLVWLFGAARTGSTWLGAIMSDFEGHDWWHEPLVGHLFGHLHQERAGRRRDDEHFILGGPKELWLSPVRAFVLDSATARFPEMADGGRYLVIKEPHGSQGAPLLMEALPESRMILLVRDPRDVVASRLDLARKGSVSREAMRRRGEEKKNSTADEHPDAFVESQAKRYLRHIELVKLAYEAHEGPKALVRYEDLRADTPGEMGRLYSALRVPAHEGELAAVVERHRWENVPQKKKGRGKFRRKATPGGWEGDLTPQQIATVEEITAPLIAEFYAGVRRPVSG